MKATGIILLLLVWHSGFSQWTDDFGDGNFEFDPTWHGDTAKYKAEDFSLRLSAPATNGSAYLSTPSTNINNASWQISVKLDFNPSTNNYVKLYLVANNMILNEALDGYYVQLGGAKDEVSLYRQDGLTEVEIIDGTDGRLSLSVIRIDIKVSRSADGIWQLSSKLNADSEWITEGTVVDTAYIQSSYFGIKCTYTSTRANKFSFDDILVNGTPYNDLLPPLIDTVFTTGNKSVIINFNEPIEANSAIEPANYLLNDLTKPHFITIAGNRVLLEFEESLPVINKIYTSNVQDLALNVIADTTVHFFYIDQAPVTSGEIIINEIMADPNPVVNLPDIEYIELHNVSNRAINMTDWSFKDRVSTTNFNDGIILPDSFLIICLEADVDLMQPYGKVAGLSPWPSLNNAGDKLSLLSELGDLIDEVNYTDSWYNDDAKSNGGWSLERINPYHPCPGYLNWQVTSSASGGSPGKKNAVFFVEDDTPPSIINFVVRPDSLLIIFSEPIGEILGIISITPANEVVGTIMDYNQLLVITGEQFVADQLNTIVISSIDDCFKNIAIDLGISFTPDFDPPEIDTVFSDYPNELEVYFNEAILSPDPVSFNIEGLGSPTSIVHDPEDDAHLSLFYPVHLTNSVIYTLNYKGVADLYNNVTNQSYYDFVYAPLSYPKFGEILITEIMVDPEPAIMLPEHEYIELLNKTNKRLLLKGLILADTKNKVVLPSGIIKPGERVLLTKTTAAEDLGQYARTFGVPNWPALNNAGDEVMILDTGYQVIHHIEYSNKWYDSDTKDGGGWSLELIDEANFCSGDKVWSASINSLGGTPGSVNSIQSSIPDLSKPHIVEAFAITNDSILIRFDESLTNQLPVISDSPLSIFSINFTNYHRDEILLHVEQLQARIRYEFTVDKILDCVGNISDHEMALVILPEPAEVGDVLVSEILFNPRTDGVDFIEVFNNSAKYISMVDWQISNGTSLVEIPRANVLNPYSFRVLTTSPAALNSEYPKAIIDNMSAVELPSLPNEKGTVILINKQGQVQDSLSYNENWHFPYLSSADGISLERIDFSQSAHLANNWASAAATENYATPGYKNSQSIAQTTVNLLSITPKVIVPEANGIDDFTTISINQSGSMVSIIIYNLQGKVIKQLANNTLIGSSSNFTWDGTNTGGAVVSLGHYIVVANLISSAGRTQTLRGKIVVGTGF